MPQKPRPTGECAISITLAIQSDSVGTTSHTGLQQVAVFMVRLSVGVAVPSARPSAADRQRRPIRQRIRDARPWPEESPQCSPNQPPAHASAK